MCEGAAHRWSTLWLMPQGNGPHRVPGDETGGLKTKE